MREIHARIDEAYSNSAARLRTAAVDIPRRAGRHQIVSARHEFTVFPVRRHRQNARKRTDAAFESSGDFER